jgi:hypothetical protein
MDACTRSLDRWAARTESLEIKSRSKPTSTGVFKELTRSSSDDQIILHEVQ